MSKHMVTVELTITRTYEIDLESPSYDLANEGIGVALKWDAEAAFAEPEMFLDMEPYGLIKVRGRVHGTIEHDVLIEEKEGQGDATTQA